MTTATDKKQSATLFAGAVALIILAIGIVGIDYTETRGRASLVPLNTQRIAAVEMTMKESAREQTNATKDLAMAVSELRDVVMQLRTIQSERRP